MKPMHWQDWVTLILGIWLILSPWILGTAGLTAAAASAVAWNAILIGLALAVLAGAALSAFRRWEEWINLILGVWLVISPWVLGFSGAGALTWNSLLVGLLVIVFAGWSASLGERHAHP